MSDLPPPVPLCPDQLFRTESPRVFATLVRLLRDFDLAEEAMPEAFAQAIIPWAATGVTGYPGGAVGTHLRAGDPWFFSIIIAILI